MIFRLTILSLIAAIGFFAFSALEVRQGAAQLSAARSTFQLAEVRLTQERAAYQAASSELVAKNRIRESSHRDVHILSALVEDEFNGIRSTHFVDGREVTTTGIMGCALECRSYEQRLQISDTLWRVAELDFSAAQIHLEQQQTRVSRSLSEQAAWAAQNEVAAQSAAIIRKQLWAAIAVLVGCVAATVAGRNGVLFASTLVPSPLRARYREEWSAEFVDTEGRMGRALYGARMVLSSAIIRIDAVRALFTAGADRS